MAEDELFHNIEGQRSHGAVTPLKKSGSFTVILYLSCSRFMSACFFSFVGGWLK